MKLLGLENAWPVQISDGKIIRTVTFSDAEFLTVKITWKIWINSILTNKIMFWGNFHYWKSSIGDNIQNTIPFYPKWFLKYVLE